ncbi:hypothetical protein ASPNIDRAFT_45130 [Aspergillus niger ATCC 1015]|uniref:Uncharacterized protein n=1 Tax=Aspergillus niger (strain ATCC 1015 / CBS 113.46 / FGSC A1144 / LSHB Ac4 / NCTC 3858a / NRRL 328 / USDA 3528.7) TaxID=380704 RepID=G3Y4I5_ASPNA|nr:hypothetical protein ASPNIDRAFT_45130 [Aspergillus niger ATCC 1015]
MGKVSVELRGGVAIDLARAERCTPFGRGFDSQQELAREPFRFRVSARLPRTLFSLPKYSQKVFPSFGPDGWSPIPTISGISQKASGCHGGLSCTLNDLDGTSPTETPYYGDISLITLLYAPLAWCITSIAML